MGELDSHEFEDDGYGRCMECADRRALAALAPVTEEKNDD